MCAKVSPSFTDENRDLRKQMGCMNGIFQLFDRHHLPTRRRISSQHHKRPLPGAHHNIDPGHATKIAMEKELEDARKESPVSFESSRTSCSSMLSSFDSNKTAQPEAISFIQIKIPVTPLQTTTMKEQKTSLASGQKSLDLRDVVKDSMYRETRGLFIKSKAKDERRCSVLKHIDSPRPSQQFKSGQSRVVVSDASSIQDICKLQEATKKYKDERLALPRFSYDERESRDTLKSTIQRKELPRLSLDSRASTMKSSDLQSRSNFLLQDLHMGNENSSQVLPSNQDPGSNKRSSTVVAKLMGLEAFSDVTPTGESRIIKIKSCANIDSVSRSPKPAGMGKHTQDPCSPRVSQKDPASPHLSNANSVKKPTSHSRFPPEPAPWRQPDTSQGSRKQALQSRKSTAITPNMSSVYGEIEKRITELEFKKSGKDLTALKHMLEAMEKTRQRLENRKGDLTESASQTSRYSVENSISDPDFRLSTWQDRRSNHRLPTMKGTVPPKRLEPSIMIMKPARVIDKIKISSSTPVPAPDKSHLRKLRTLDYTSNQENSVHKHPGKDLTPRNNLKDPAWHIRSTDKKTNWRTSEVQQTSKAPQCIKVESRATCGRSSGMVSPRLKQKQQRIVRESHPTTPSSDSGMIKKKCSKQVVASGYPNRKLHPKSTNLQHGDDQLSEHSDDTRYSSHHGDTASMMSESNISLISHIETEVESFAHSIEMNAKQHHEPIHRNSAARLREHTITVELPTTMLEQPSPVSVLDAAFCRDDSPSPVKKTSTAFRDDESPNSDDAEWHVENLNGLPDCKRSHHRKLYMIEDLVHKLRLLNPTPYEDTLDHTAFMYESPNPNLRYITKILLASGLLRDVISVPTVNQHHSSYHLINPDLFDVLEQTEQNMKLEDEELHEENANQKIHRKIVFDTVNEILIRKFSPQGLFTLGRKRLSLEELPKEVHLELNRLQRKKDCSQDDEDDGFVRILTEDMKHQSADWAEYTCEIPALVLDIERLIFKDLINEVVTGEVMGLHN